ncbi:hypothetical protein COCNU_scaffold011011G000030 [Cocos nucifera]|nr:hypothetical protein [Cocos nucifera]
MVTVGHRSEFSGLCRGSLDYRRLLPYGCASDLKDQTEAKDEASKDEVQDEEEEKIDPSNREAIRKLLEPFGKDQLMQLKEAALKNPSLHSHISTSVESNLVHHKIFVHGLD